MRTQPTESPAKPDDAESLIIREPVVEYLEAREQFLRLLGELGFTPEQVKLFAMECFRFPSENK
ncbi:MAG: hypothetical protein AAB853_02340 [Patescibacteria group bacterium]